MWGSGGRGPASMGESRASRSGGCSSDRRHHVLMHPSRKQCGGRSPTPPCHVSVLSSDSTPSSACAVQVGLTILPVELMRHTRGSRQRRQARHCIKCIAQGECCACHVTPGLRWGYQMRARIQPRQRVQQCAAACGRYRWSVGAAHVECVLGCVKDDLLDWPFHFALSLSTARLRARNRCPRYLLQNSPNRPLCMEPTSANAACVAFRTHP